MIPKQSIKATKTQLANIYKAVDKRDANTCQICGEWVGDDRAYHHIVPKGRLKIDHIDNFSLLHTACHRKIHDGIGVTIDEFIELKRDQLKEFYCYNNFINSNGGKK